MTDFLSREECAQRIQELQQKGVRFVDSARVYVDSTVECSAGVLIWPDVVLRGTTRVEEGAEIRPGCWLQDTHVGSNALIKPHTVCEGAVIGPNCSVGPMAHLRPKTVLHDGVKVGNFVEVKKSTLEAGAKASHLSYLGDSWVGAEANIGAGTITCNYDGHRKQNTRIGAGAFIGSNSALVAPVSIGAGSIVGAGSVITKDIPENSLAVERAPTKVIENRAHRIHDRNRRLAAKAKQESK